MRGILTSIIAAAGVAGVVTAVTAPSTPAFIPAADAIQQPAVKGDRLDRDRASTCVRALNGTEGTGCESRPTSPVHAPDREQRVVIV